MAHHEIIRPAIELSQQAVEWVLDKAVGPIDLSDLQSEALPPVQPRLPFDDMGNWHNPDGEF